MNEKERRIGVGRRGDVDGGRKKEPKKKKPETKMERPMAGLPYSPERSTTVPLAVESRRNVLEKRESPKSESSPKKWPPDQRVGPQPMSSL